MVSQESFTSDIFFIPVVFPFRSDLRDQEAITLKVIFGHISYYFKRDIRPY